MRIRVGTVVALILALASCGDKKSVKEQELEVELAKAKAAQAQAEAEKARIENGDSPAMDAQQAKQDLDKVVKELDELEAKTSAAVEAVTGAQNDAERDAATARLKALQKEYAEKKNYVDAARVKTRSAPPTDMAAAKNAAEAAATQAMKDAAEAKENVEKLMKEVEALDEKIGGAVDAVTRAENDADRTASVAVLKILQQEQAELKIRVAEARAAAQRAERMKGVKISKECMDNPLAKGCS